MSDGTAGPSRSLPPGWTSHVSPAGRTYYHNATSGVSTYDLPRAQKQKREKPTSKTPIPKAAGWFKVTTNKGNVFYFHPETKTSEWLPAPQIAGAVRQMEEDEAKEKERMKREAAEKEKAEKEKQKRERRERKRKAEEGVPITEFEALKRARADDEDDDEDDEGDEEEDALSITSSDPVADQDTAREPAPDITRGQQAGAVAIVQDDNGNDDDEEWQRELAEQMAAEAEAEAATGAQVQAQAEDASAPEPPQPEASASLEDQKRTFMAFLSSLDDTPHPINPMAPWDLELPKFSKHSSFLALPSQSEREDTFNEWCRLRIRERRAAKAAVSSPAAPASASASSFSNSKPAPLPASGVGVISKDAKEAYLNLLREEVRSTRTRYADFRSAFSRDHRFASFGRSDTDREKLFKAHLIELGEQKRVAAERAEECFLDLLSDRLPGNYRNKVAAAKIEAGSKERERDAVSAVWMEAKRTPGLPEDKRYDAVGSSTRRFELFSAWAKGERRPHASNATPASASYRASTTTTNGDAPTQAEMKAKEKEEARRRALREREEKVRRERDRIQRVNRNAFSAATRQESMLSFRQLLLDAIHSSHVSYHSALPQLARDPRFDAPGLSDADREQLFEEHQGRLGAKEGDRIGRIFGRYAKSLDAHPEDVVALTLQDEELSHAPLSMFRDDPAKLEKAYAKWDQERQRKAEEAFKEMLTESAFVEFWGRLKKQASTANDSVEQGGSESAARKEGSAMDGEDGEEGEGTTLLDMAKGVDLREIQSVLRHDARFRAWRHEPKRREQWIREHLEQLAEPKKSVHD